MIFPWSSSLIDGTEQLRAAHLGCAVKGPVTSLDYPRGRIGSVTPGKTMEQGKSSLGGDAEKGTISETSTVVGSAIEVPISGQEQTTIGQTAVVGCEAVEGSDTLGAVTGSKDAAVAGSPPKRRSPVKIPVGTLYQAIGTGSGMTVEVIAHRQLVAQDLKNSPTIVYSAVDSGAIKAAVLGDGEALPEKCPCRRSSLPQRSSPPGHRDYR